MWRRVEEARREDVAVAQLRHVVAKEVAVEALSEASLLAPDKQGALKVNAGVAVMVGCLMAFAFSPRAGRDVVLEVPRRDEDAEAEKICEDARKWKSSSAGRR